MATAPNDQWAAQYPHPEGLTPDDGENESDGATSSPPGLAKLMARPLSTTNTLPPSTAAMSLMLPPALALPTATAVPPSAIAPPLAALPTNGNTAKKVKRQRIDCVQCGERKYRQKTGTDTLCARCNRGGRRRRRLNAEPPAVTQDLDNNANEDVGSAAAEIGDKINTPQQDSPGSETTANSTAKARPEFVKALSNAGSHAVETDDKINTLQKKTPNSGQTASSLAKARSNTPIAPFNVREYILQPPPYSFPTARHAIEFLQLYAGDPLMRFLVANDDVETLTDAFCQHASTSIYNLLLHAPPLHPDHLSTKLKQEYWHTQTRAIDSCVMRLQTGFARSQAIARVAMLIGFIKQIHIFGVPRSIFFGTSSWKLQHNLTCMQRLERIQALIRDDKCTTEDFLAGITSNDMVYAPDLYAARNKFVWADDRRRYVPVWDVEAASEGKHRAAASGIERTPGDVNSAIGSASSRAEPQGDVHLATEPASSRAGLQAPGAEETRTSDRGSASSPRADVDMAD